MRQFAPSTAMYQYETFIILFCVIWQLTNKRLTTNIAASIREEIHGSVGNVADMAKAAEWLSFRVGLHGIWWQQTFQALMSGESISFWHRKNTIETCTNLSRCDRARRNDVGSHPARTILDRNTIRQGIDTGFGNGYMGLEGHTPVVDGGTDEDNSSAGSNRWWLNWKIVSANDRQMVGFAKWCTHESSSPFCVCLLTLLDTEELPWGCYKSPRRQYP